MTNAPSIALKKSEGAVSGAIAAPAARRTYNVVLLQLLQFVTDLLVLNITYHLMLLLRFGAFFAANPARLGGAPWSIYPELEIFLNLFWAAIAILLQVYRPSRNESLSASERSSGNLNQIRSITRAGFLLAGALLLFIVAQGGYIYYSRLFLAYFLTMVPIVLITVRIVTQAAATTVRQQKSPRKNILVIGAGSYGERFYDTVSANPAYGYRVLGFLDDNGVDSHVRPMILGTLRDLTRIANRETVDEVVIALPKTEEHRIAELVTECEDRCIRVALLPNDEIAYGAISSRAIERVGEFSLVRMHDAPLDEWASRMLKRTFDIVFSVVLLLFIFPLVFLVSAIMIKLGSRGPIFFKQARTGEDGKTFVCYKFRTMYYVGEDKAHQATRNDPRMTSFGRILRRTSMDELPQFWNALKGDMSVVGPRPHPLKLTEDYRKIISQYMVRHFVKPGLTGWAQVNGYRGETKNPDAMERRIEHDLYYIENWSFLFDLTIVARTIACVLSGDKNAY